MKPLNNEQKQLLHKKITAFNPDENGLGTHGIFGLPFEAEESQIVLLPVPWEVTVSYGSGTSKGPSAILKASQQLDLYDPLLPGGWKAGIAMLPENKELKQLNDRVRAKTELYLQQYGNEGKGGPETEVVLDEINESCLELNMWVKNLTKKLLAEGKFVGLVGGEHSVTQGYVQSLAEMYPSFGILQVDAHADLRRAYEGFSHSHASIMYNTLKLPQVKKLVQMGVRDVSQGEVEYIHHQKGKIRMYSDYEIRNSLMEGMKWSDLADNIISQLPELVYVSFDIDGLQPWLCPHTGTPVPGGFTINEVFYILEKLVESGRKLIGFDLVEVSPGGNEWDANVGARVLYKMCLLAARNLEMEIG